MALGIDDDVRHLGILRATSLYRAVPRPGEPTETNGPVFGIRGPHGTCGDVNVWVTCARWVVFEVVVFTLHVALLWGIFFIYQLLFNATSYQYSTAKFGSKVRK